MDKNHSSAKVERLKELLPDIFNADGKIDMLKLEQQLGNENIAKLKSENDRSAYEVLFHKNPLSMWVYDIESLVFLEVNEAAIRNYGYSKEEFLSMTIKDIRPTEDMHLLLEKLKPENYKEIDSDILRHLKKNGEIIYVQISAHFIDFEGRKARHILAHDITQERSWEKALHQRDYWLTESQKAGRIGSYSFKITEGYWKSSETLDEIFGIEKTEQKSFEEWANLIHPDDREEMLSYFDEYVLTGKKKFDKEYRVLRPDGVTLWVWGIGNLTFDDSGKPVKMMGTIQDITERKLAENALKQAQHNYESFFNTIDDFLFVLDQKGDILHYNETVAKRLGYTDHELRGQSVMMVHPEDRREEAAHIVGEMLSGKMDTCPIPIMTKSGEQIPVETRITHGEWNGMPVLFGVSKDISKLQFSEEKFSKAFQLNSSACGLTNLEDGTYVEVNQAFCALFGYEKEEVIGKNPLDLGIFSTATRRAIQKHQSQDGKFANVSAELKTKKGEIKQVLLSAENIIIQSISYRYTEVNDITDQIHLMNALRGSEEKYRFLAENATDVIWSMDLSGKIDYISPSVFNLRGYTASETVNQSFSEIFAKDSITKATMLLATKAKLILSGERPEPVNIQLEQICKNGTTVWTEMLISATYNENGQFVQFQGVTRNIQEQKIAENSLRASEERFRSIIEISPIPMALNSNELIITYLNKSFIETFGYTLNDISKVSDWWSNAYPEKKYRNEVIEKWNAELNRSKETNSAFTPIEVIIRCKDGRDKVVVVSASAISESYEGDHLIVLYDITEQKAAADRLVKSEEQFRLLAENSTDVIWTMDIDGRYSYISPSISKLRGYSVDEVAKQTFIDAVSTNSIEDAKIMFHSLRSKILSGQKFDPQTLAIELQHKDGSTVWSEIVVDAIFDKEGKFLHVLGITRNIDQRKKAEDALEESRARYRTLSDASFESIFVSQKGVCLEQNKTAELVFGYTHEEALGRYGTEWIIPEDREMVMQNMVSGYEQPYEATALRKDGTTFPCILKGKMMKYKGKDVRITSLTDISTLKETENELRESREKYRLIFHNSPFGIISFDTSGKITACNDNFVKIIGSSQQALIGLNMLDLPDQRAVSLVKNVLNGESDLMEGVYKSITSDKRTPVRAIYAPIINADGQISGGVGIIEDITERVNAQKAQYESEEKYRLIFENSPLGIISFDQNGVIIACNNHFVNIIGSSTEKLVGLNMLKLPDKQMIDAVGNSLKGKIGLYEGDYQSVTASKMTPVRCTFSPIYNLSGELSGGVGIIEDITERKLAEQEIQKIIHHYKSIIENAPDGIVLINAEGQFVDMSPSARRIFGYEDSDPVDIKPHEYTHPDDLPMVLYNLDKLIKEPSFVPTLEYRFRHRNGDWIWIESTFSNAFADPAVEAIIINFRDINDRKNNEAELIESEMKYRYLVEYSPDAIVIYIEGKIVFVNEAGVRLVKASSVQDLIGKSVLDFVHPDSRALVIERMKQVLKVGTAVPIAEEVFLRLDGSTVEVDVKSMPIQYGDKRAAQLIIRDISEHKAAERAILESEKRYKALFATSPSGITIVDEYGIILEINQEITNLTGYSREELVGQPIYILGPSDRVELVKGNIRRILLGETLESEVVTIHKDGTQSFFYLRETAITLPNGRQGVLSVSNDITARKDVEDKLKESEDRYRTMIENSNDMIWTIDRNGNFLFLNEIASKTAGIELEDWRGKSFVPLLLVDDIPMITDVFHRTINGEICSYELRLKQPDESIKTILTTTSPIYVNGKINGIVSFGQDITDRKKAEDRIRENEINLRQLLSESTALIDENSEEIDYSKMTNTIMTLSGAKYCAMNLFDDNGLDFTTVAISGVGEHILKAPSLLGFDLINKKWKHDPKRAHKIKDKVVTRFEHLHLLAESGLPKGLSTFIEKSFNIGSVYVVKALQATKCIGDFTLIFARGEELKNSELVSLYSNQVGLFIQRKITDNALRDNERILLQAQEVSRMGSYVTDVKTGIWTSSKVLDDIFGIDDSFVRNLENWRSLIFPEHFQNIRDSFYQALQNKSSFKMEYKVIRPKDGKERWVYALGQFDFDKDGNPIRQVGTIQDITERKLAVEILRESEQRFSDMAINSSGVVYQFFARKDGTTGFYYMSPKAEEMFGFSPNLNSSDWNLGEHVHSDDIAAFMNAIGQAIAQVQPLDFECRVITSVGVKWIQFLSRPTLRNDEVVFNGIMIDVTERKQTQELLEKSREEFKALFDKAPIGYHEIDNEGRIVRINEAELKMFGRSYDEMIGQQIWNFIVNKDESKAAVFAKLSGELQPLEIYERELASKDGTVLNVLMKDRILKDDNGKIIGIQTTVQNITIRKKTEVALRVSQERLNTLIEASPDFICFKDDIGRWQIANKAAEELFCLQNIDYIGKSDKELSELTQPFFKQAHLDCIESDLKAWAYGKAYNVEEEVPQLNGFTRVYDVIKIPLFKENGDKKALIVLGREITERKKIENELRQSEKKYSELFTQMLDGFALHEIICDEAGEPVDYRFLDVNPAFEKQTGLKAKDIVGKTVLEVMPRTEHIWIQLYGEVALTGHPTTFDNFSKEIGKHYQVNAFSPVPRQFACLISDITERKNAEATIRDYQVNLETLVKERTHELMVRETYLSAIVDNHPGMFWMKDSNGKFIFSNRANTKFLRLAYGESAEEIIGKTDFDFCPPFQAKLYKKEDNDVAKLKKEITSEDAMIVGTKEYWFEKLKFPVIDTESNTIGVAGYSIDITDRIRRDARLRMQSEAFESFALTIVITNKDGIIEWANPAFEKLTGYRIKEVVGEKANMLRSGKMSPDFYKDLWSTVLEGKVWSGEFLNKRKDGSLYYEESTITPVRDREGMISHFIALKTNITHRKEMEEALRISDERWQFAIEGSGDGVYDTDLVNQKQFYSPHWKSMLGYDEDEIGDTMDEWNSRIHPDDMENALSEFQNYLAGATNTYNNEHRLRCKNGSYKWVLTRGKIVERNEKGAPTRLIGTLTDITEIKLLEESLRRNIEKERELNDIKSRFVATASHEFRTPLASILITNDTLMNYWHRLEENQIDAKLQKIKSNVLFLTNIVNDVMQLSKIQEGKLEFNPQPLDVVALCNEIVNEFKEEQLQNSVEFVCDLTSLNLNLDLRLMRQTFNNLLSNASKYSHGSTPIHIEMKIENNEMLFSVQDHGIGIPKADQKRLFTPFFRASNSKMIQGNGLGLNIILEAAKMHGGDITFESTPDVGSTFVLHIPITNEN